MKEENEGCCRNGHKTETDALLFGLEMNAYWDGFKVHPPAIYVDAEWCDHCKEWHGNTGYFTEDNKYKLRDRLKKLLQNSK